MESRAEKLRAAFYETFEKVMDTKAEECDLMFVDSMHAAFLRGHSGTYDLGNCEGVQEATFTIAGWTFRLGQDWVEKAEGLTDVELSALASLNFSSAVKMQGDNQSRANQGLAPAWDSGCADEYETPLYEELKRRGVL